MTPWACTISLSATSEAGPNITHSGVTKRYLNSPRLPTWWGEGEAKHVSSEQSYRHAQVALRKTPFYMKPIDTVNIVEQAFHNRSVVNRLALDYQG